MFLLVHVISAMWLKTQGLIELQKSVNAFVRNKIEMLPTTFSFMMTFITSVNEAVFFGEFVGLSFCLCTG